MNTTRKADSMLRRSMPRVLLAPVVLLLLAGSPAAARAADEQPRAAEAQGRADEQPRAADEQARAFPTPDAAVAALVEAAKADDEAKLLAIFGADAKPLLDSGDPVADEAARQRFVRSYDERHELGKVGDTLVLSVGDDDWPFPIPLVQSGTGWRFDTARGQEEVLDRRIGANELHAIQTCLAYVDAQREYHDRNPQGAALPPYAQQVMSSPGKRDGLYWQSAPGEAPSPLGEFFADASGEGYEPEQGKPMPYHGYYYRILKAQGPHAAGGPYDYVVRGEMIGGFALVAYPAEWDSSGVMTFVVNQDGVVYQADLGPETEKLAQEMKLFDPDQRWTRVPDQDAAPPR